MNHLRHFAAFALLAMTILPAAAMDRLEGTYRLVSATRTIVETGAVEDSFGPNPVGYIMYDGDGRMMVLIVSATRPKPSFRGMTDADRVQLFETMAAYSGSYSFDGKVVRHDIDQSWNSVLTGTTQIRQVRKEGGRLIYTTNPGPAPTDGKIVTSKLVWQRVKGTDATEK